MPQVLYWVLSPSERRTKCWSKSKEGQGNWEGARKHLVRSICMWQLGIWVRGDYGGVGAWLD